MWVHEALAMQEQSGGRKRLPAEESPPLARKATERNQDMVSTECDLRLEGTNKEAGSPRRTKNAKQQSRVDPDGPAPDD